MDLATVFKQLDFLIPLPRKIEISGVALDSREIKPGYLFVAFVGHQQDATEFIPQAIKNGAVAVLCSRKTKEEKEAFPIIVLNSDREVRQLAGKLVHFFANFPAQKTKNYGVTGTNGKTTITHLLAEIFGKEYCGTVGTIASHYKEIQNSTLNTTPSPTEMTLFLNQAIAKGMTHLAFEASSHALDQERLSGLTVNGAIFTNLTSEHLDYHPNMQHYAQTKRKLFQLVKQKDPVVLNLESPYYSFMKEQLSTTNIWTYGLTPEADIWGEPLQNRDTAKQNSLFQENRFLLYFPTKTLEVSLKLLGQHNILNALGAATLAYAEGIKPEKIVTALSQIPSVPGRLERVPNQHPVFIDYAHTPDALTQVLSTLKPLASSKLICVFGCGGNRDQIKRPLMGKAAEKWADLSILTSDNPRFEDPQEIIQDIVKGFSSSKSLEIEVDRKKAIYKALDLAQSGDVILIAGKGHEEYQQIGTQKFPFSDRLIASQER